MFGMLISIGTTAFDPYAKENRVAPVEVFAVVLYNHKTPGSLLAHLPFACSSHFLSVLTTVLFIVSTWPFNWGCLGVAKVSFMFHSAHKSWNAKLMNCGPLSVTISFETPNLQMIFFHTKFFTSVSLTRCNASASTYLVK